ncbi:MAG: hypothetical protein Q4C77_02140 [Eubacteriales bacterium]|nr:hypothetical protein [Eubacteriales bacterium]
MGKKLRGANPSAAKVSFLSVERSASKAAVIGWIRRFYLPA